MLPESNEETLRSNVAKTRLTDTEVQPGSVLGGRYKVLSVLGVGGMGVVYRVNQIFLDKEFALKTIDKRLISDVTIRRFQQEARAAFAVEHPSIIAVNDFGLLDDQTPFLVMEIINGETLGERLKKSISLTVDEAMPIFVQVCFGLAHAHNNGIVHRDIKPSNIMLLNGLPPGAEGAVKIVDFGIAKFGQHEGGEIQALTRTGEILGSPLYMSPEQCAGERVDHRADIYSLGCVLFEALTGTPPYVGENALATMMLHQTAPLPTLKEASLGTEFPQELERIVSKMLAKTPEERYQDLGMVACRDLGALGRGESNSISHSSAKSSQNQAPAKTRTISMASSQFYALLAGIALLAGSSGYLFSHVQSTEPPAQIPTIQKSIGEGSLKREADLLVFPHGIEDIDNSRYVGEMEKAPNDLADANASITKGRFAEAELLLKRSLESKEKALGANSPDLAELHKTLADCYMHQGYISQAEQQYQRALAMYEKSLEPNDQRVALTLLFLAKCYLAGERYVDAEPLLKRALTIYEKALGPNDLIVGDVLVSLGYSYFYQDRPAKAEARWRRAAAIYDKENIGPNDPRPGNSLRVRFLNSYTHLLAAAKQRCK